MQAGSSEQSGSIAVQDEAEEARASLYALLGRLLLAPPDAALLDRLAAVDWDGDDTPLGQAGKALTGAARDASVESVSREHFDLFIGVGRGELVPYGSYYLTGFLHEKPLARLRGDMAELGIVRADGVAEPEDHIGQLCEMMAGLIAGDFIVPIAQQQRFFDRHLAPWAGRFFSDLERASGARFYRAVGVLGRTLVSIETDAFALAA